MAEYCLETEEPILSPNPHESGLPLDFLDSRSDLDIFESGLGTDHFDSGIGPDYQDFGAREEHHVPFQKSGPERLNSSGKKHDQPFTVTQIFVPDGFPIISEDMETLITKILNLKDHIGPLVTLNGIEVTKKDIECLSGPIWLNDKVND
jgi:hypothetical protein